MRMTRRKDSYPCRIKECHAEEWMREHNKGDKYPSVAICNDCPFEILVNKLAEYEDREEMLTDDGK